MKNNSSINGTINSVIKADIKTKNGIFLRCWNGDIKLWKAFWIVHVLGFILAGLTGLAIQIGADTIFNLRLPSVVSAIPIIIIGFFSMVTLWRSSPAPTTSIKGAFAKMWVLIFSLYLIFISYNFITT